MNNCLKIAISTAMAFGVCAPLSAEVVPLFDATPITNSGFGADITKRKVFDQNTVAVYCDGTGSASVQAVGGGNLIVDNYMTLNDADGQSICENGNPGLPVIGGTNCFSTGSSSSAHWGKAIEDVFTSSATAVVDLVDGENELTFKLWDWGGVYGNTALELALPDNCSGDPIPDVRSMCAGQHMDIGDIVVTDDAEFIYVYFEILEPGWYLAETHVAVNDIPLTSKGNPVPGQFPYACELDGSLQTECVVAVPRDGLSGDVDIAAHASVFELAGDGCASDTQYASEVLNEAQGLRKNGTPVLMERSDGAAVFDPADGAPGAAYSFYSLGFGGSLELGFGYPVFNGPGTDVCMQEITNGRSSYPEERVDVSADGAFAAEVSNRANGTGLACIDLPGGTMTAGSVTLTDTSNPLIHDATADGYDIDWVGACYLYLGDETAWGAACYGDEGGQGFDGSNWATYFTYTIQTGN